MHKFLLAKNPNVANSEIFIIHALAPVGVIQVIFPGGKCVLSKPEWSNRFKIGITDVTFVSEFTVPVPEDKAQGILTRAYHWYISNENKKQIHPEG